MLSSKPLHGVDSSAGATRRDHSIGRARNDPMGPRIYGFGLTNGRARSAIPYSTGSERYGDRSGASSGQASDRLHDDPGRLRACHVGVHT